MNTVTVHNNSFCGLKNNKYHMVMSIRRSQWPRGLRRRSAAARLLRSWVRISLGAWKFVCCECCMLSGRGLCDELITRPEESYRLWCVVVCDLETSRMRTPLLVLGRSATGREREKRVFTYVFIQFSEHYMLMQMQYPTTYNWAFNFINYSPII